MHALDILKMIVLVYIIFVVFLEPIYLSSLHNNVVYGIWIGLATTVFLFIDIVMGILLFAAWIITYIRISTLDKVETNVNYEPETIDQKPVLETRRDVCDGPPVPMEGAAKGLQQYIGHNHIDKGMCENAGEKTAEEALEKYVVDDYLKKAAEDGIIEENMDLYPNSMGTSQYNIQGIEKNMVGYNYKE